MLVGKDFGLTLSIQKMKCHTYSRGAKVRWKSESTTYQWIVVEFGELKLRYSLLLSFFRTFFNGDEHSDHTLGHRLSLLVGWCWTLKGGLHRLPIPLEHLGNQFWTMTWKCSLNGKFTKPVSCLYRLIAQQMYKNHIGHYQQAAVEPTDIIRDKAKMGWPKDCYSESTEVPPWVAGSCSQDHHFLVIILDHLYRYVCVT